jgi:hypothetical protein
MPSNPSRRRVLAALPVALLAGCLEDGDTERATTETPTETPTDSPTFDPDEELARLPEPSPLSESLRGLVAAEDRAAYAEEHSIDYRDGSVKVFGELDGADEPPDAYVAELVGQYEGTFVAWVAVEDLVDLALHDGVRIVRRPPEPRTDGRLAGDSAPDSR